MNKFFKYITILLLFSLSGCAYIDTNKANLDEAPDGIRVYPPKVYLFVGDKVSYMNYLPDYAGAYDIKPKTILSSQDFTIELEDGMINKVITNQDTTAIFSFLQSMGELGAKVAGAGAGVSAHQFDSNFGLLKGVYILQKDGSFKKQP